MEARARATAKHAWHGVFEYTAYRSIQTLRSLALALPSLLNNYVLTG